MPEQEKQPHQMKAAVILAAGVILFFLWFFLWSYGVQYWPVFRSLLPPSVYFPAEEFLGHNGSINNMLQSNTMREKLQVIIWAEDLKKQACFL